MGKLRNGEQVSKAKTSTNAVAATTSVDKRKVNSRVSLKNRIDNVKNAVRSRFDNAKNKLTHKRKKAKKVTKTQRNLERQQKIRGIIGIGLLFVVVSIAYSTYMTNLFVDGPQMIAFLAPQVLFATVISLYAFYKILKTN